jgi:exopolyphosphatase/guanosine-5'-triphosphate,3'-diphosphate pyrophosphatase
MAARGSWTQDFERQVVNSAMEIGTRYDFDREHAEQVAELSKGLFESLWEEHLLDTRQELILTVAALLHEVGRFVSSRSHHKHSLYLIQNSDVFGLGPRDLLLAGLVARYHRKAEPKSTHQEYMILERTDRVSVAKMAAILRVADALACGPGQRRGFHFVVEPGTLTITVDEGADLALEQHRLRQKAGMFEQVYGMRVVLCRRKEGESDGRPKSGVH